MSKIVLEEQATPSTPSINKVALYTKTGGNVFKKDGTGTEEKLATDSELVTTSGTLQSQIDDISGNGMFKSVYDTNDNGVVDEAERIDGGNF